LLAQIQVNKELISSQRPAVSFSRHDADGPRIYNRNLPLWMR